nr:immunoglobulin heavy chain junction region [Macaca mulatta]
CVKERTVTRSFDYW